MDDLEYMEEIAKVQESFGAIAQGNSVGVVLPAAMNIALSAVLSIEDKSEALRAAESLRPMIDYMEARIKGLH
jgi:hypothetical protein